MTDILEGSITVTRAPEGTTVTAIPEASYTITLQPIATDEEAASGETYATPAEVYTAQAGYYGEARNIAIEPEYFGAAGPEAARYMPSVSAVKAKPTVEGLGTTVVYDSETTGLTPWDSRLVMGTFWHMAYPKADMVTFADMDEELLVMEIADYLNTVLPETIVAFNIPFDVQFLASRLIKYQIGCAGLYNAKFYDVQDWCKKGSVKYGGQAQKSGTLEDWALYLFGEAKPFSIEECFEAYDAGDIVPFYIRNRWDVAMEGDMYRLIKYVENQSAYEEEPYEIATVPTTGKQRFGTAEAMCANCKQRNIYDYAVEDNRCFICGVPLPKPE